MAAAATATANLDDRPSDPPGPLDPEHYAISSDIEQVQVTSSLLDTAVVEGVKSASEHVKEDNSRLSSNSGPSLSTNPDLASDVTSVHSLPAAHIAESQRPPVLADSSLVPQPTSRPSTAATQSPASQQENHTSTLSQQQRRARHRSAIEVRSSNRLSGFFNNLIHRREPPPSPAPDSIAEDQNAAKPSVGNSSRSPSPTPTPTISPPPPPLPPPTLRELGLSLSVVTSDLSPSHFTTPPVSGAFLAPHYLLLCHAQGLDVLPLTSPPAPQPYALVRRVAFKSVVVMEHRGVLVAIAGRRDGVRVYALEEVKKAIEWRIDVEVRRERERRRREAAKRIPSRAENELCQSGEKVRKASLSTPPLSGNPKSILRKASHGNIPSPPSPPPAPLIPRAARTPTRSRKSRLPSLQIPSPPPDPPEPPLDQPPPYASSPDVQARPTLRSQPSAVSVRARVRSNSVNHVLAGVSAHSLNDNPHRALDNSGKSDDWAGSSDDEAIDIRASAGGSQALDERTSATLAANRSPSSRGVLTQDVTRSRASTGSARRQRPSNLDLSAAQNTGVVNPEPSPTPTLLTLRQALQHVPQSSIPDTFEDGDEDEDEADGRISLTQALMESRMPDIPPPGSVQPQEPILISPAHPVFHDQASPRSSEGDASLGRHNTTNQRGRRRRWSVMLTGSSSLNRNHTQSPASASAHDLPQTNYLSPGTSSSHAHGRLSRSPSSRSNTLPTPTVRSSASADPLPPSVPSSRASIAPSSTTSKTSRSSRFFSRFINSALSRRSDERSLSTFPPIDADSNKWLSTTPPPPPAPPPKLEYVKLPGTKGALLIKAVETQKKSFLAILCGENGEKVELFAGTYRTALGLSRTFILPDSPRSLELQLQGDDLVEVFLVFAQNVFGLEPATVRVREVRIGRAERRAARRRARENRTEEPAAPENEANEDDTNISIGVSVTVGSPAGTGDGPARPSTPPLIANEHPDAPEAPNTENSESPPNTSTVHSEELFPVSNAQMGPYTTFQQLSFAPNFPLASIADEYIIPPTYPNFLEYRDEYEQKGDTSNKQSEVIPTQFSPPGLPIPAPSGPTQWYYKDPKGIMHGPWNSSLMQAWYRDGLLPADLPVRREGEADYTLLKDLKLQCIDPAHPFRSPPLPSSPNSTRTPDPAPQGPEKPLLSPISLLVQPKHFGPPALFFSSRGGHSTTVVDARGRSVLKGRFIWTTDDTQDEPKTPVGRMGDVKHLEALDIKERSILIAMRQGGLEAVDFNDALLRPADQSRTILPSFQPSLNTINRRPPFVWKIGTPVSSSDAPLQSLNVKGKSNLPKKGGMGISKSTGSQGSVGNETEGDSNEEVLFLGRKEDEIYYCERNAGSFRVLRLCPDTNHE